MLTTEDKDELRQLRKENPKVWTFQALADLKGVSKHRAYVIVSPHGAEKHRANQRAYVRRQREEKESSTYGW